MTSSQAASQAKAQGNPLLPSDPSRAGATSSPASRDATDSASTGATEAYKTLSVGGIPIRVFGLAGLPKVAKHGIAVLYLLHGREANQDRLKQTAIEACEQSAARRHDKLDVPLLCVTLDHRNHGNRIVDAARNASLRDKSGELVNPTHAVDMCAIFSGTAADISLLLDYLPATVFPTGDHVIVRSALAGVSLGGHATWAAGARDIRLQYLAPILSSPSMLTLLAHRQAPFPSSLGNLLRATDADRLPIELWGERNVLLLAGADDTLVPHVEGGCAEFVEALETVSEVEVYLQPGTGHVYTDVMKDKLLAWLAKTVCVAPPDDVDEK